MRRPLASLALLLLAACKEKTDAGPPAPSSAPPARAASGAQPLPRAPESGPLVPLGKAPEGARVIQAGERAYVIAGGLLYEIDGKGIHQEPALHRGIPPVGAGRGAGLEVTGAFPEALWLVAWSSEGPSLSHSTYRWSKDRWARVSMLEPRELLLGVVSLQGGRAVGLAADPSLGLRLIRGNDRALPPSQPSPAASSSSSSSSPSSSPSSSSPSSPPSRPPSPSRLRIALPSRERATAAARRPLAGLPTGHLFVVGNEGDDRKSVRVERWSPAGKSEVNELPGLAEEAGLSVAARAPDDACVYTAGSTYLARFDGKGWRQEAVPNGLKINDMVALDGVYYLATEGPLLRRGAGDAGWEEVPLPQCGEVLSVASVGGKLWAIATAHGETLLLGPRGDGPRGDLPGPEGTQVIDDVAPGTQRDPAVIHRFAPSPYCTRWYVALRSQVSPSAQAFPEVAAKIKAAGLGEGVELVTEKSPQWTYLGARVPSAEAGKKLIEATGEGALYCHAPRVAAKIALE